MEKFLEKILKSNINDLKVIIKDYIKELTGEKYELFEDEFYLFFKLRGSANKRPILLSCHMDTVHSELPISIEEEDTAYGRILSSKEGIGGDDRAGVYALLKIVERFVKYSDEFPKYLLFTDKEEEGYIGAKKFVEDFKDKEKIGFVVELDAAGDKIEFFDEKKIKALMISFKTSFPKSAKTYPCDMFPICEGFNASGVNAGVGYNYQHKKEEIINLDMLNYQILKISSTIIEYIHFSTLVLKTVKRYAETDI